MNKNEELLPYYESLSKKIIYNPDTGVFVWTNNKKYVGGKVAGSINVLGYRMIGLSIDRKVRKIKASRLAWFIIHKKLPLGVIDHVNGIKGDDRAVNHRDCTNMQNLMNQKISKNNKSGYKGVRWHKRKQKWESDIKVNGVVYYLGSSDDPETCAKMYNDKAIELHGEFAKLNKIG